VKSSDAGLVLLGLAEVPQVMSAFLPSPTTAYMGGADPARVEWLRRGEIVGGAVSLAIAGAVSMLVGSPWVFLGSAAILGVFLWEYERAIKQGEIDRPDGDEAY
jgi:hypothetical protein